MAGWKAILAGTASAWVAAAVWIGGPATAEAAPVHEEAVLRSASSAVPAGGKLALSGADFAAGERYALRLVGALQEYDLREVEPEEDGTFELTLAIPAEVRPGLYRLVAVAPDGDVSARLELAVLAAEVGEGAEAGSGAPRTEAEARHDDMPVDRRRGGLEWTLIGLVVGLSGGVGLGLLRQGTTRGKS